MDFFFLDDIIPVIERIFVNVINPDFDMPIPNNVNLTYVQKNGLIGIAQMIAYQMKTPDHKLIIEKPDSAPKYMGSGAALLNSGIPMVGLQEGIRRTISELT